MFINNSNNTNSNRPVIIGVDHGFGNVKTAHTCFRTGVTAHDKEPTFKKERKRLRRMEEHQRPKREARSYQQER